MTAESARVNYTYKCGVTFCHTETQTAEYKSVKKAKSEKVLKRTQNMKKGERGTQQLEVVLGLCVMTLVLHPVLWVLPPSKP